MPPSPPASPALYADAGGLDGLVGGQAEDALATDTTLTFDTLERIHRRKTGVLFSAAATAGALSAGASPDDITSLTAYAKNEPASIPAPVLKKIKEELDGQD